MKKKIILMVTILVILLIAGGVFALSHGTKNTSSKNEVIKKENSSQNYTVKYALKHYKSYDDLLKDNKQIQWVLSDKTYVLKGDGSSKHSGGWRFKNGKGNMIESGHDHYKIDYIVTTDNRDVTTLGAIKKAFEKK